MTSTDQDKAAKQTLLAWQSMHTRCYNPRDASYKYYGARGIIVCPEWSQYDVFLADVGMAPKGHSLDRIKVDLHYTKDNCQWATPTEQARNKTNTRWLTLKNETLSLATWAERLHVSPSTLRGRLARGWTVEQTLTRASQAGPNTWRGVRPVRHSKL